MIKLSLVPFVCFRSLCWWKPKNNCCSDWMLGSLGSFVWRVWRRFVLVIWVRVASSISGTWPVWTSGIERMHNLDIKDNGRFFQSTICPDACQLNLFLHKLCELNCRNLIAIAIFNLFLTTRFDFLDLLSHRQGRKCQTWVIHSNWHLHQFEFEMIRRKVKKVNWRRNANSAQNPSKNTNAPNVSF